MPYIKQERRDEFDSKLGYLSWEIKTIGELNYMITMLCKNFIAQEGESYTTYNSVMGVLSCSQSEIYRRLIAEYEDKKIIENGDVF